MTYSTNFELEVLRPNADQKKKHATPTTFASHTSMSWLSNIGLTSLPTWLQWPSRSTARHVLIGVLLGFSFSWTSTSFALYYYQRRRKDRLVPNFTPRPIELRSDEIVKGVAGLIGMHHDTREKAFSSIYEL